MALNHLCSTITSMGRRQSIPYLPLSPGSPRIPFLKHQRSPVRIALVLVVGLLIFLGFAASILSFAPPPLNRNLAFYHTPSWLHPLLSPFFVRLDYDPPSHALYSRHGVPEPITPLLEATWPGDWVVPELTPAQYTIRGNEGTIHESLASPALIMLHIFSSASPEARQRREFLRKHSPLSTVPVHFQHLVDLRYIVFDSDPATWDDHRSKHLLPLDLGDDSYAAAAKHEAAKEENEAIQEEHLRYRDIVRIEGPTGGFEATWEWIRWAGSPASREGHWLIKCTDEMLPVLPNIIPNLMSHDPTVPTYFGSSIARKAGYDFYFDGGMYGFSWGLLQTLAETTLDARLVHAGVPEDAMIGHLMYQLPSKPLCRDLVARAGWEMMDEGDEEDEGEEQSGEPAELASVLEDTVDDTPAAADAAEMAANQTPAFDRRNNKRSRQHARDFDPETETYVPDHHRSSWPHRLKSMLPFTSKWDTPSSGNQDDGGGTAAAAAAAAYSEADDRVQLADAAFPHLTLVSGECLAEPVSWDTPAAAPRGGWRSGWPPTSSSNTAEDGRTGLVRLDWETSVGVRGGYGTDEDEDVLGWRIAKPDGQRFFEREEFEAAYKAAWRAITRIFEKRRRPFEWDVPEAIQWLYEESALNLEGL